MRRANGTGTITKLSGTRRRPYIAKYCTGKGTDNKRRYTIVGYYATKKEANIALAQFSLNPDPMSVSNITFAEVYDIIKCSLVEGKNKNTKYIYSRAFKKCESLHNIPLRKLRAVNYQQVLDGYVDESKSSNLQIKTLMNRISEYGVQNDIINKNYAQYVRARGTEPKEKVIYTDDEIKLLFSDGSVEAKQLLMLIYSGFRIGEFSKITKADVDLDRRVVVGGSKTKAGKNRIVPIHHKTFAFWQEFCSQADGLLFPNENGTIRHKESWYRKFCPLHKRLGIPYRTPHTARHTCASIMARDGMNPLYIKEILGHATYSFTADKYTHVDTDTLVGEIDKMK